MMMPKMLALVVLCTAASADARTTGPILDMHLHAYGADENGPPPVALCVPVFPALPPPVPGKPWPDVFIGAMKEPPCNDPVWSSKDDAELKAQTLAAVRRAGVIGVLGGPQERVRDWVESAPKGQLIPSLEFSIEPGAVTVDDMRRIFTKEGFKVLGEVANQYRGVAPDDPRMEPYWALMEELQIPVAYHMGSGPPGTTALVPKFRASLANPLLLEPVLAKHPRLRIAVMHYGEPFVDEMTAILAAYPQVYVDLGGLMWGKERALFYEELKQMIDSGFANRIMFGSDNMNWPGLIDRSIAIIDEATFLTKAQKRDIFYANAARFLDLSSEQIAEHHRLAAATPDGR